MTVPGSPGDPGVPAALGPDSSRASIPGPLREPTRSSPSREPLSASEAPPIDPNRATLEMLLGLPGVGPVLARRILEDRAQNGPYRRAEDLLRVAGIGPATLRRLRPHLRFEESPERLK